MNFFQIQVDHIKLFHKETPFFNLPNFKILGAFLAKLYKIIGIIQPFFITKSNIFFRIQFTKIIYNSLQYTFNPRTKSYFSIII